MLQRLTHYETGMARSTDTSVSAHLVRGARYRYALIPYAYCIMILQCVHVFYLYYYGSNAVPLDKVMGYCTP